MDSTMMAQVHQNFYFQHDYKMNNYAQQKMSMYQAVLPASPASSRPGSSSSQPPTLYSNGPAVMTPAACPPINHKAIVMLDTEDYFPSTPPLSASGSAVGSPKSSDVLQTPLNPMFSGLDGFGAKSGFDFSDSSVFDWARSFSPPVTPVFIQSQPPSRVPSLSSTTSDLSAISCPSLSPSPAPYARSVTSENDVDFCDPRNLIVSTTSNPTLAPEFSFTSLDEEEAKVSELGAIETVVSQPVFDFSPAVASGLPAFEELSEFETENDFSKLISSGDGSRPRACTGSSVVSLGHGSFIGDEDFSFDDEALHLPSLDSPPSSVDNTEDNRQAKRQKKSNKKESQKAVEPVMNTAAADTEEASTLEENTDSASPAASDSQSSSGGDDAPSASAPAPTNRRGRKQSLTEDPSKTFVCDLCNRRFRRQEHLKRHYRSLHTQEKPFECNECGKKFSRSDNLAQHARTHATGGAIVMDLLDGSGASAYEGGMVAAGSVDDYANYGKVLFQIASEVPGSASELSSEETSDGGKKKRKRSD